MKTVRPLILAIPLILALGVPATAQAGGWATTGVDALPASPGAGDVWRPTITVKQHGISPMDGLKPSVRITSDTGMAREFPARPAGGPGEYVAAVRFPAAGRWSIRIFDGFTDVIPHELGTFTVTGPLPPPSDGGAPWPQAAAIAAIALLFAAGWLGLGGRPAARRRRRVSPATPVARLDPRVR
jgi:hypothetical protein